MRYELTDFEWTAIRPFLPNKPRGVPRVNDRRFLNGIFWILRSDAPWRDLPEGFGPLHDLLQPVRSLASGWHLVTPWARSPTHVLLQYVLLQSYFRAPPSRCRADSHDSRRLPPRRSRATTARPACAATGPTLGRMEQTAADADRASVRRSAAGHRDPAAARSRRRDHLLPLSADLGAALTGDSNGLRPVRSQRHRQHQLHAGPAGRGARPQALTSSQSV